MIPFIALLSCACKKIIVLSCIFTYIVHEYVPVRVNVPCRNYMYEFVYMYLCYSQYFITADIFHVQRIWIYVDHFFADVMLRWTWKTAGKSKIFLILLTLFENVEKCYECVVNDAIVHFCLVVQDVLYELVTCCLLELSEVNPCYE